MKKIFLISISIAALNIAALISSTQAFAQMGMMGPQTDNQSQQPSQMNGMNGQGMMGPMMGGNRGMMGMGPCMMGRGMMGHGRGMMNTMQSMNELEEYLMYAPQLGLTQDQKDRIRKIKDETTILLIKKRADLRIASLELHSLMAKTNPDKQAVAKQIDKMSDIWKDMQKISANAVIDARSALTPEQRQKALQY